MKPHNPVVEIFRAGRHTAMDGRSIEFSETDLGKSAEVYDPSVHEAPAVIGHPKSDAPAYGWVRSLTVNNGRLNAQFGEDVDPAFVEMVRTGRFKHVSASFYEPDCPVNPKPGSYYLRHVGFLGAQPPAVKGLRPVEFGASDKGTIEFSDPVDMGWVLSTIARLFRGWRDSLIADKGLDAANKVVGDWDIQTIEDAAAKAREPDPSPNSAFSEPNKEGSDLTTQAELDRRAAELQARDDALKARETAVGAKEASFTETATKTRHDANTALLEKLASEGRIVPAAKPGLLAFMDQLDASGVVSFGEGDAATKQTPLDYFRALLSSSGKVVNFGEVSAPGEDPIETPSDPLAFGEMLGAKATAYIEEQRTKGITVSSDEAVRHIMKEMKSK